MSELEAETKQERFDADFLMMTETFSELLKDLMESLSIGAVPLTNAA